MSRKDTQRAHGGSSVAQTKMIELKHIEKLNIQDGTRVCAGARQDWYAQKWRKRAGCGPVTCATLLWYMAQTCDGLCALCPYNARKREGFLELMNDVWHYATPGRFGLRSTAAFVKGIRQYAADRGISLACDVMDVPTSRRKPQLREAVDFIADSISRDRPVAFLNLSAGFVAGLQNWHWVPIVGIDPKDFSVRVLDGGDCVDADFALWLRRTARGGGLVAVAPG